MGRKLRFTNIPVLTPVREAEKYFIYDIIDIEPFFVSIENGSISIFGFNRTKYDRDDDDLYSELGNSIQYYEWFDILDDNDKEIYYDKLITKYTPTKIFIGKSVEDSLTSDSEYYYFGPEFDGNTILLEIEPKRYVLISNRGIYEFQTEAEIVEFHSPIGNEKPLPFAIDKNRNYYLLSENVILSDVPENTDPFKWYWVELDQIGVKPIKKKVIEPKPRF